uniref:Uncharacterized protein n=1 Tax=Strigamia maritima TaxID=126957 RepID=T1JAF4_STRMM
EILNHSCFTSRKCLSIAVNSEFLLKKRLPNSTTGFVRKDVLPLGTFSKYTWHITSILRVKQIFDTSEMPLGVVRNFVENRDNTYESHETPKCDIENNSEVSLFRKTETQPLIKPFELKTFLKVGNTSTDEKEPTLIVIEWIHDVLPKMKIGELRIKFEYGHQRNGVVENRLPIQLYNTILYNTISVGRATATNSGATNFLKITEKVAEKVVKFRYFFRYIFATFDAVLFCIII